MNGKEYRVLLDQELEGRTTVAEVIKDLPLYDQILNRGQLMGKLMSRNLIEVVRRQHAQVQCLEAACRSAYEPKGLKLFYPTNAGEMVEDVAGGKHGEWVHVEQASALIELNRVQQERIERLEKDRDQDTTIDERDRFHDVADSLAQAISKHFRVDIGEHSSANCPWSEALGVMNGVYETDSDDERRIKHLFGVITATYQDSQELRPTSTKQLRAYTRITERLLGEMGVAVPS